MSRLHPLCLLHPSCKSRYSTQETSRSDPAGTPAVPPSPQVWLHTCLQPASSPGPALMLMLQCSAGSPGAGVKSCGPGACWVEEAWSWGVLVPVHLGQQSLSYFADTTRTGWLPLTRRQADHCVTLSQLRVVHHKNIPAPVLKADETWCLLLPCRMECIAI